MSNKAKSKKQRQEERDILDDYHKLVTEEALEPLYNLFVQWKEGTLPYNELTEHIHVFHKRNQEIFKEFNYGPQGDLLLYAKLKLGRLTDEDIEQYGWLLERWGYSDTVKLE